MTSGIASIGETLRGAAARAEHWWLRDDAPHALALFRIVFGLFLLLYWGSWLPSFGMLFTNQGLSLSVVDQGLPRALLSLIEPPPPAVGAALYGLLLTCFALLVVGFLVRTASVMSIMLLAYVWATGHHASWFTMEYIILLLLFILALGGAEKTLSLTMRLRRGSWFAWEKTPVLPQRLVALQVTATLLGAGWVKLVSPDWQTGEIIAYALVERWATPPAQFMAQLNIPLWFSDVATRVLTFFEWALPFGLWSRAWRFWVLGLALFLLQVAVFLSFWWFLVLVPSYVTFFEPAAVRRKFDEIVHRFGGRGERGSVLA